jgi:hypothetical protein
VDALQVSSVQGLLSLHINGPLGWQAPAAQLSAPLQAFPSPHELESSLVNTQAATGSQESSVQGLSSLQASGVPDWHTPEMQESAPLQTLLSLHELESSLI